MRVSVVICTYADDRYDDFVEATRSVLDQTYDDVELVLVIDGNEQVCEQAKRDFGQYDRVTIHCNAQNSGLSYSRTRGVEHSTGDVISFIDDDALAERDWIEELVRGYEETDAIAVGGRMVPEWVDGPAEHVPEEFYWLIGANYERRLEPWSEVRNTLGSNMSFRREVFEEVGGFDEQVGLSGDNQIQAEETELSMRMYEAFGKGMLYNPDAVVAHKIFAYRTGVRWLIRRAFWQGYSKRAISSLDWEEPGNAETAFLKHLVFSSLPRRVRSFVADPSLVKAKQFLLLWVLTFYVGLGYLYGFKDW